MMLQHALAWAARGYRVFPCWGGSKRPAIDGFPTQATTDPEQIRRWWTDPVLNVERNYNIGVSTDGMLVVDIDVKDGRPGMRSAIDAGVDFDTLTVRTASGGLHLYYQADNCRNSVNALGPGVDTRGHGGYVLAPGSVVDGKSYTLLRDGPTAPLSAALAASLERSTARLVDMPGVDLDLPVAFEQAREYLAHRAPPAIEGQGGHDQTYRVACMVRDFGLSEEASADLMLEIYNPRCVPPWDVEELKGIVGNANHYAQNTAGSKSEALNFAGLKLPEAPKQLTATVNGVRPAHEIPPRPWIVPRLLLRDYTTLLIAEGSAGKSTLILALAAHLALGHSFLGYTIHKPVASVIYNAEDDRDEMDRRLHAVCQWFGFDVHGVMDKIAIVQPNGGGLQLTSGDPPTVNRGALEELIAAARAIGAGMIALDPLVELHSCREDDNVGMRYVMGTLRLLAKEAGAAVLVAHHTSKAGMGSDNRAGNMNISRGASAIVNSARIALTISPTTDSDVERYAIPEQERRRYVRLDDAKMNMALVSDRPTWLKREGVTLANGDDVGVLTPFDMTANAAREASTLARLAVAVLTQRGCASLALGEAASALQGLDPLYAQLPLTSVKARLEQRLSGGVSVQEGRIRVERRQTGAREAIEVILD